MQTARLRVSRAIRREDRPASGPATRGRYTSSAAAKLLRDSEAYVAIADSDDWPLTQAELRSLA